MTSCHSRAAGNGGPEGLKQLAEKEHKSLGNTLLPPLQADLYPTFKCSTASLNIKLD